MPTYLYKCAKCAGEFEVWQSFSDKTLTKHPGGCGGKLAKVIQPAGIVLKGSGFYKNDSRDSKRTKVERGSPASSEAPTTTEKKSDPAPAPKSEPSSGSSSDSSGSSAKPSTPAPTSSPSR